MRESSANYVRMRLWVNPPAGYNDLSVDLAVHTVAEEHEAEFGAGLTGDQRAQLVALLRVVAQGQGLHPRGMPGSPPGAPPLPG